MGKPLIVDYEHTFSDGEVRQRLEALGDYLQNRHGINVTWKDDGGGAAFKGRYLVVKIRGELSFGKGSVHFRGEDPGFLWRKRAQKYMREKLEKYLDPKKMIEDLPRGT